MNLDTLVMNVTREKRRLALPLELWLCAVADSIGSSAFISAIRDLVEPYDQDEALVTAAINSTQHLTGPRDQDVTLIAHERTANSEFGDPYKLGELLKSSEIPAPHNYLVYPISAGLTAIAHEFVETDFNSLPIPAATHVLSKAYEVIRVRADDTALGLEQNRAAWLRWAYWVFRRHIAEEFRAKNVGIEEVGRRIKGWFRTEAKLVEKMVNPRADNFIVLD